MQLQTLDLNSLKKGLEVIYADLPELPCLPGCTACCVSPTLTLVEFIFLLDFLKRQEKIEKFCDPSLPPFSSRFKGHRQCRFHALEGLCSIHPGRPLACRLHGLPVIESLGVVDLENCTIMDQKFLPQIALTRAKGWLEDLVKLNERLSEGYGQSFLRIVGLHPECWFDIAWGPEPASEELSGLREKILMFFPDLKINRLRPVTEIAEKASYLELLEISLEMGDLEMVKKMLTDLEGRFNTVGGYWESEARELLKAVEQFNKPPSVAS